MKPVANIYYNGNSETLSFARDKDVEKTNFF